MDDLGLLDRKCQLSVIRGEDREGLKRGTSAAGRKFFKTGARRLWSQPDFSGSGTALFGSPLCSEDGREARASTGASIDRRACCHRKAPRTARVIACRRSVHCTPVTHWELLLRFSFPVGDLIHALIALRPPLAPCSLIQAPT